MIIGVTGATGGLGKRLIEMLLEKNIKIKILVRKTSNLDNLNNNIEIIYGDILDINSLNGFVKGIDVCIHTAAQVGYTSKKQYMDINKTGSDNLCKSILLNNPDCKLIYCSTISTLKVNPFFKFLSSNYGISKYYAERTVLRYAKKNNLRLTVIYPGLIYGPYDKTFFPQLADAIKKGSVKLIKGGENNAPLIYADELCELFIRSALNEIAIGKKYISVKGLEIGIHEVIKIIAGKLNCKINNKVYPKTPFLILAFLVEIFFKIFQKNKKPFLTRTIINNLSINFKDYKKKYDDPKADLNWEQNTTKQFFIDNLDSFLK